jgi:hypothetical protein|tara:strand:- start:6807 stop:7028 length:222 start_codon:yes stop_codon:yes gene_type:complete
MIIRKISIGEDYKSSMHYITGQEILGGKYKIHLIYLDDDSLSYKILVEKEQEVYLWKEFNNNMPVSVEYNMNF